MHDQDAVEEHIGEWQRVFLAQQGGVLSGGPGHHPEGRGHGGDGALGFAKFAQIGNREAIAQQPAAGQIGPELPQLAQNRPPRQLAQRSVIESGKVAHILRHEQNRRRARLFKERQP